MPGKVNPVVPEVANQTAFYIIGADLTVTMAADAGQLQLNVMEPVISFALFTSISYLTNVCDTLHEKCVVGITANAEHAAALLHSSIGIVTQLNPVLGYQASAGIAKEAPTAPTAPASAGKRWQLASRVRAANATRRFPISYPLN